MAEKSGPPHEGNLPYPPGGPYHIVNKFVGKHLGPFTTELDGILARTLSDDMSWRSAEVMNYEAFKAWLHSPVKEGDL
ncbi:MAG TPA: hypothetical protein VMS84_07955 [Mycobacterium sp.]|nr:hypothetical protein [Mycobacterium sp.]